MGEYKELPPDEIVSFVEAITTHTDLGTPVVRLHDVDASATIKQWHFGWMPGNLSNLWEFSATIDRLGVPEWTFLFTRPGAKLEYRTSSSVEPRFATFVDVGRRSWLGSATFRITNGAL